MRKIEHKKTISKRISREKKTKSPVRKVRYQQSVLGRICRKDEDSTWCGRVQESGPLKCNIRK